MRWPMCRSNADIGPPGTVTTNVQSGPMYALAASSSRDGSSKCSSTSEQTACVAQFSCCDGTSAGRSRSRCTKVAKGAFEAALSTPERLNSNPSISMFGNRWRASAAKSPCPLPISSRRTGPAVSRRKREKTSSRRNSCAGLARADSANSFQCWFQSSRTEIPEFGIEPFSIRGVTDCRQY